MLKIQAGDLESHKSHATRRTFGRMNIRVRSVRCERTARSLDARAPWRSARETESYTSNSQSEARGLPRVFFFSLFTEPTLLTVGREEAAGEKQARGDPVHQPGTVPSASRHRPLALFAAQHLVSTLYAQLSRHVPPDRQANTVIAGMPGLGGFLVVDVARYRRLSTDVEQAHPDRQKSDVRERTARLSLAAGRKQNPTFTWWPRASRGGAGTPRPSRSFPSPFRPAADLRHSPSTSLWRSNERGPALRKSPGTGFSKNLRTAGERPFVYLREGRPSRIATISKAWKPGFSLPREPSSIRVCFSDFFHQ